MVGIIDVVRDDKTVAAGAVVEALSSKPSP